MSKQYPGIYVGIWKEEWWYEKGVDEKQYAPDIETRVIGGRFLTFKELDGRVICLGLNSILRMVWAAGSAADCEITTSDKQIFKTKIHRYTLFGAYVLSTTVLVEPVGNSFEINGSLDTFEQN